MPNLHPAWQTSSNVADTPRETLEMLEDQRRRAILALWRTIFVCIACLPVVIIPALVVLNAQPSPALPSWLPISESFRTDQNMVVTTVFGTVFAVFVALIWYLKRFGLAPKNKYLWDYKRLVFTAVCEAHFPKFKYLPQNGFSWREFDAMHLFPFDCDEFSSEDRFEGQHGATDVQFAEARAARITRNLRNKFERSFETYFKGIVFVADFHKHFHSKSRIVPRGEKVRKMGQSIAELESLEFSNAFSVWTTDQIDLRYILSTSMMERLLELSERHPLMRASFSDEKLLLLLPSKHDYFEARLYSHAASSRQIQTFINDVQSWLEIVDDLNLNTRIWSKH